MFKKILAISFSAILAFSCSNTVHAANTTSLNDPFKDFLCAESVDGILSDEHIEMLSEEYPSQIAYIEEKYELEAAPTTEFFDAIKTEAYSHCSNQNFSEILKSISQICFEESIRKFNTGEYNYQQSNSRGRPDALEVRNASRTYIDEGALYGQLLEEVAGNTSVSHTKTVTISAGREISIEFADEAGTLGDSLTVSTSVSDSVTYTAMGPSSNQHIANTNIKATTALVYGIMYGQLEIYTYDLYYKDSGELYMHNEIVTVNNEWTTFTTFYASLGMPSYLEHPRYDDIYWQFANAPTLKSEISYRPWLYHD